MNKQKKLLGKIGSQKHPTIVNLSVYKGNEMIDIRKHFTDKSGDLQPTRKGISLTRRNLYPLLNLLGKNIDEINDFFEADQVEEESTEYISNVEMTEVESFDLQNHKFFEVQNFGGKYQVSYNKNHPFWSSIDDLLEHVDDSESKELIQSLINSLLISFFKSTSHVDSDETIDAGDFLLELEINWSSYLKRLVNGT